jgi:hypothetical protein
MIDIKKLCHGNINHPVLLSVFHHKSNGCHVLIGQTQTCINDLISEQKLPAGIEIQKDGTVTGLIKVHTASIVNVEDCRGEEDHEMVTTATFRTAAMVDEI